MSINAGKFIADIQTRFDKGQPITDEELKQLWEFNCIARDYFRGTNNPIIASYFAREEETTLRYIEARKQK